MARLVEHNRSRRALLSGRRRAAAILMELVISMAIFVGAGMLTMSIVSNGYDSLQMTQREQLAVDLARSKLAELEAGLISLEDIDMGTVERVGSIDFVESFEQHAIDGVAPMWFLEIETSPTPIDGLTLIELTVTLGEDRSAPSVTLRQLIEVRGSSGEAAYEDDELTEGLPSDDGGDQS